MKRANGTGTITRQGYIRHGRKGKLEHRLIWEKANGTVPIGMEIHHINKNKSDNRLENLMLVDDVTHKRLDMGYLLIGGVWWKYCNRCHITKMVNTDFYQRKNGWVNPECHDCRKIRSKSYYQRNFKQYQEWGKARRSREEFRVHNREYQRLWARKRRAKSRTVLSPETII